VYALRQQQRLRDSSGDERPSDGEIRQVANRETKTSTDRRPGDPADRRPSVPAYACPAR
jgi:hypothetical protein